MQDQTRQPLCETAREWAISTLLALPFLALYIYVDRHPSWGGVLLVQVVSGLLISVPTVGAAMFWEAEERWEEPDAPLPWRAALGVSSMLAWVLASVPWLLTPPSCSPLPGPVDTVVRCSWWLLCAAAAVALVRGQSPPPAARHAVRLGLAAWVLLAGLWPWTEGLSRSVSGVAMLAAMAVLVALARWVGPVTTR